jgi:hypothetical protein
MTEAVPTGNAPIRIVEQAYALWAEPESAIVTLATPQGRVYTTLPLAVRSGRTNLAPGGWEGASGGRGRRRLL